MAKCTGLDLVLVMRLEVEWLAWPPSSFLLLFPLFIPSFLLDYPLLWSDFSDFQVCVSGVGREVREEMREKGLLCILFSCNVSFSLFFPWLAEYKS